MGFRQPQCLQKPWPPQWQEYGGGGGVGGVRGPLGVKTGVRQVCDSRRSSLTRKVTKLQVLERELSHNKCTYNTKIDLEQKCPAKVDWINKCRTSE